MTNEVALAKACAAGESAALAQFEATYAPLIRTTARRFGDASFADEIVQAVRERLLLREGAAAPRIGTFTGEGPLAGFVQATTVRVALNRLSSHARHSLPMDDEAVLSLPSNETGPELAAIRQRFRAEFKEAFAVAMQALDHEVRTALRLYYLDGLSLADLGKLYDWSVPTASRRLASARTALLSATRAHLGSKLGLNEREIDSVLRLLESRLSGDQLAAN